MGLKRLSKLSSENGIDIGGEKRMVILDPFSLLGVGIYEQRFASRSTVLVLPAEEHLACSLSVTNFVDGTTKDGALSEVSNNRVLKMCFWYSLSCNGRARKSKA